MPAAGPSLRAVVPTTDLGPGVGGFGMVIPYTVQPGDSMVVAATRFDFAGVLTGHGWALIATNVYWKVATSLDPGTSVFLSTGFAEGALVIYKDAASTQPLVTRGTSATAPAITTSANLSTVTRIWITGSASSSYGITPPATVELQDPPVPTFGINSFDSASGAYSALAVSDATQAVAGVAPSATATPSHSVISWVSISLAFFPAVAPLAPILGTPLNNSSQFLAGTPTFSWATQPTTGDGAQNAYAFRRKIVGAGSYEYWNATSNTWGASPVWNAATASSVTFPAAAWSNSSNYVWSVATQEATYSLQGPFAADFTVDGQVPPTVTVTGPTGIIFLPNPTITWTDTVSVGTSEVTYRAILYSAAQYGATGFNPGTGPSVYDSGVSDPYALIQTTPDKTLVTGTYRAYVQITETNGIPSAWAFIQFAVEIENPNEPDLLSATSTTDPVTKLPIIALVFQGHDNELSQVDAGVETGTGSWTGTNATLSHSSSEMEEGGFSLKIQAVALGAASAKTAAYPI